MKKIINFFKENILFFIIIAVIIFATQAELPYAIYTPGGAINLTDRISGDNTYKAKGSFSMTYVSMVKGSPLFLLSSYILPNWDVVRTSSITYDGEDLWETVEIDKIYLNEAYSNAQYVAYTNAEVPFDITSTKNLVTIVDRDAITKLKPKDEIIAVDDINYTNLSDFSSYIETKNIGDVVKITYIRDGKTKNTNATLININEKPRVGVGIATINEYKTKFNIKTATEANESGPSGGFLTALEIYNKITENDITKGKKIMGTGTIAKDGVVGEIGGVKYKVLGAVRDGAEVFICPKENEKEALKTVKDNNLKVTVIGVHTFKEALEELSKL